MDVEKNLNFFHIEAVLSGQIVFIYHGKMDAEKKDKNFFCLALVALTNFFICRGKMDAVKKAKIIFFWPASHGQIFHFPWKNGFRTRKCILLSINEIYTHCLKI